MLSTKRQCEEVTRLLAAIQTCFDRRGRLIPCRADEFRCYIDDARLMMGVS